MILERCPLHTVGREAVGPSQRHKGALRQGLTERGSAWEDQGRRARLLEEMES